MYDLTLPNSQTNDDSQTERNTNLMKKTLPSKYNHHINNLLDMKFYFSTVKILKFQIYCLPYLSKTG